jgi:hypothetical protein
VISDLLAAFGVRPGETDAVIEALREKAAQEKSVRERSASTEVLSAAVNGALRPDKKNRKLSSHLSANKLQDLVASDRASRSSDGSVIGEEKNDSQVGMNFEVELSRLPAQKPHRPNKEVKVSVQEGEDFDPGRDFMSI